MAEEKKLQAAGAFAELKGPWAVANAYGDIGADSSGLVSECGDIVPLVEKLSGNFCADDHGALYSDGGRPSTYAVQVVVDAAVGAKAGDPIPLGAGKLPGAHAGNDDGPRRGGGNLSSMVGVFAASSAVTAISASAVSPPVAFGFFLVLLGGIALAMASVRAPR